MTDEPKDVNEYHEGYRHGYRDAAHPRDLLQTMHASLSDQGKAIEELRYEILRQKRRIDGLQGKMRTRQAAEKSGSKGRKLAKPPRKKGAERWAN